MENEVVDLCYQLSLTNLEEDEVCVVLSPLEEVVTKGSHCLLSKLLSFGPLKSLKFFKMGSSLMLIEFEEK